MPDRIARAAAAEFDDLDAPKAQLRKRGRPKGTKDWVEAAGGRSDQELAGLIAAVLLRKLIYSKRAPTGTGAALEIGWRLKVAPEKRASVGRAFLEFAYQAGLTESLRSPQRYKSARRRHSPKLELSLDASLQIESLFANYLREYGDTEKLLPAPDPMLPVVTPKWDQRTPPPAVGSASAELAAQRIGATAWQVNPGMLALLEHLLPSEAARWIDGGKPKRRGERTALLKEYGELLFPIMQARQQRDRAFYFPLRFDHRGRIHQLGGALTYTGGSDTARALLGFATAEPVGEDGLPWLARHVLNTYGGEDARRVPIGSEIDWIEARRELIARTADDPHGSQDWRQAKQKYRFIAACRAWQLAEQGAPIRLPVSVDATTSVLQHIALLLRDVDLAKKANVWPGPRQDFYDLIVDRVREAGITTNRDEVKNPAMTRFYGSSEWATIGRVAQKRGDRWRSEYRTMVQQVRAATVSEAPAACALHDRLCTAADAMAARGQAITWTTPSGWQCVQDRLEHVSKSKSAYLPDGTKVPYSIRVLGNKISRRKQTQSLCANLIQSLDASLLHLAIADPGFGERPIAVAHDCFAVHAEGVPWLIDVLKGALARMYGSDVLAEIWRGWGDAAGPVPDRGPWDARFTQGLYTFC